MTPLASDPTMNVVGNVLRAKFPHMLAAFVVVVDGEGEQCHVDVSTMMSLAVLEAIGGTEVATAILIGIEDVIGSQFGKPAGDVKVTTCATSPGTIKVPS